MTTDWKEQLEVNITSLTEASKTIGDSDNYYVYIIWKMYTPAPVPFYIGKGHWQRLIKHEMKSDAGNNNYKTNIIRKHERLGLKCGYSVLAFYQDEDTALQAEIDLISLIGRADLDLGPLTNRTDGGDGARGFLAPKGGDNHSARPVFADGARYACVTDAAKEFDISLGAVSARIKNGWEGYYYEDEGQRPQSKKILGRYKKAVAVQGQEFLSASDASRELGIDVRMISKRISFGWEGYFYLDQGQLPRKTTWSSRKDKVAVTVRGVDFSTIAEAVKANGESESMISKRSLSTNFSDYSRLDGKIVEKEASPKFPEGVLIGTTYYESIGKAADAVELTDGGVAYRCRSENYPEWRFSSTEKQRSESFTPEFSSVPVPVIIEGCMYNSQSVAALAHSIDINTLKRRCKSISFPNWVCDGVEKTKPKDGKPGLIHVEIEGIKYKSVSEASRALGLWRGKVKERIDSDEWPNYKRC